MKSYWFLSVLYSVVVGSEAVPLGGQAGAKFLRNEGEGCGILLSCYIDQKLQKRNSAQYIV